MKSLKPKIFLFSLFFFQIIAVINIYGQKIQVLITDSVTNKPVELATVYLTNKNTLKSVKGLSDAYGKILLSPVLRNHSVLSVTSVGYLEFKKDVFLAADTAIYIRMKPIENILAEVKVTGAVISYKPDRLVYSVNQQNAKGKNLMDIIRDVPMVSVTGNDMAIKGNSKFQILQNNNPSSLTVSDLRTMAVSRVERIEVITAPSAKYDGEYENIINIIMKKDDDYKGGVVSARIGNRSSSAGVYYTKTNEKVNTNIQAGIAYNNQKSGYENETEVRSEKSYFVRQRSFSSGKSPGFNSKYQTEISLTKKQYISLGVNLDLQHDKIKNSYLSEVLPLNSIIAEDNESSGKSINGGLNANYSITTAKSGKIYFSNFLKISHSDFNLTAIDAAINSSNTTNNTEFTSQIDYELTRAKNIKIEAGLKFLNRSYYLSPTYSDGAGNKFKFNQAISSGYLSASKSIGKMFFRLGSRLELTNNRYDANKNNALNLLPNLLISYAQSDANTFSVVYKRSLKRPGFNLLNTFVKKDVSLNESVGNPTLTNEYFNTIRLENNRTIGDNDISLAISYSKGNNQISNLKVPDALYLIRSFYDNVSASEGADVFFSFKRSLSDKKIYLNLSGNLKYYSISGAELNNKGLIKTFSAGASYNPSPAWSFDFYTNYLGNSISLQSKRGNSIFMDLMVRYQYKNSAFLLQATNPIIDKINEGQLLKSSNLMSTGNSFYYGRSIALGYAFIFGNTRERQSKTKRIENNDIRPEEKL